MRYLFLLIGILAFPSANAQIVDGVDLSLQRDVKYIQVSIGHILNAKKQAFDYIVGVDFGQEQSTKMKGIIDSNGQSITFKSDMDAINYLAGFGWRIVSVRETVNPGYSALQVIMERDK